MDAATQASCRTVWSVAAVLVLAGIGGGRNAPAVAVDPQPQKALPPIAWRKDWAAALQEARTKKQPVLLVVAFPTCKWWLRMERTTFADPQVRVVVSSMIPVLLHGGDDGIFFELFKVSECPLIAICDAAGKEAARLQGLQEPISFLNWLKRHSLLSPKQK